MAGGSYQDNTETVAVTIAVSDTATDEILANGLGILGLELPAAFQATTTHLAILAGQTSGSLDYLRDKDGTTIGVTVAATNVVNRVSDPDILQRTVGWRYLQLEATTGSAASTADPTGVTQTTARSINVVLGKVV